MSTTGGTAPPDSLPPKVIVVSTRGVEAAAFAADFYDGRIVTPDELSAGLEAEPAAHACVALVGTPLDEGSLSSTVQTLIGWADRSTIFILAVSADEIATLVADPSPLRGLSLVDVREVSGRPCALLRVGEGDAAPDLSALLVLTGSETAIGGDDVLLRHRVAALEAAAAELEVELQRVSGELVESKSVNRSLSGQLAKLRRSPVGPLVGYLERAQTRADGGRRKLDARRKTLLAMAVAGLAGLLAALALLTVLVDESVGWFLSMLLGCGVLLLLLYLVRGTRRIARQLAQADRTIRQVAELAARSSTVERNLEMVAVTGVDLARTVAALEDDVRSHLSRSPRRAADAAHNVQAVVNLFSMFPVEAAVPLMGGWAASADAVLVVVEELLSTRPALVVECGSGVSTLWLALAVRKHQLQTRIVSLEHDAQYAEQTRAVLRRHGVEDLVEVRHAPLSSVDLEGHHTPWYDAEAIADLQQIGLLFVDGPPEATGERVRYPALPLLRDRFADRVTIVLDDYVRASEQEITRAWVQEMPELTLHVLPLEKGAAVLRR